MITRHLKEILKVELMDLVEDLQETEDVLVERFRKEDLTQYVFKGNDALLKREALAISGLKKVLGYLHAEKYTDPKDFLDAFLEKVKEEVEHLQSPKAVISMVERRCRKAFNFVMDQSTT